MSAAEMPHAFVERLANLVIDSEGDGVNYHRDITLREALGNLTVADIAAEAWAAADWRVLGGLVPGVIHAEWLRDGDRIRINTMEGVVRAHVIDRAAGFVNFVFVTETGQVINTRSLDSEVRVIAATTGADQ